LLVEVTHSQNDCQLEAPERCWMVVVMRTEIQPVGRIPAANKKGRNTDLRNVKEDCGDGSHWRLSAPDPSYQLS
jgi:hypothetical protein